MIWKIIQWRSLNTRVTLFTLIIFVVSIWALAFYATRTLHTDMERQLGEQQFSTVSLVAADINQELDDRLRTLEVVARGVRPTLLGNPAALQIFLEERPALLQMFNAGTFVTGIDGTAIASIPVSVGRIGVNYLDRDFIIAALKEGKPAIGKPVMGKLLKSPIFVMAVPIRDAQGRVIGALMGVTDLGQPGFLDKIAGNTYGKTGGYLLVAPQHRLIVTATDKNRIMTATPAPGLVPLIDRFMQGYEESGIFINPVGVEVLSSAKNVPVAGWQVVAQLPTAEAFAPIHEMQQRIAITAFVLTVLSGLLTWWMLRRQLAPMLAASKLLATLSATNQPPQPLPITRQDEIGDLIGGFNRLLETLQQRDTELRQSEFRWKFAIDGSGDGLWDWNVPQSTAFFSPRWKEMLGFAPDEIGSGLDEWSKRVHPDDLVQVMADVQAHLDGTTPLYINEHRVSCKNGSYKWILDRGVVVERDAANKPLRMIGTHTDVTERKQAEENFRRSENKFRMLFELSPIGLAMVDHATGEFLEVNNSILHAVGYTKDEFLKLSYWDITPREYEAQEMQQIRDLNEKGRFGPNEKEYIRKDGSRYPLRISGAVFTEANDRPVVWGVIEDITKSKQAEAELSLHRHHLEKLVEERTAALSVAKEAAEAANRAKTIFLANMSHELRTPMNGIMGMTALALRRATDPKQADYLQKAESSALRLLLIINDVLDISKIEADRLSLANTRFVIGDIFDHVHDAVDVAAHQKGIDLSFSGREQLAQQALFGDPTRLGQVLLNLVSNAIKFTDFGSIDVRLLPVVTEGDKLRLAFEVQDNGIGILPADQKRVFLPFEQVDGSSTRAHGGTGLGLFLCKRLVEQMGGSISVDSQLDVGSIFRFDVLVVIASGDSEYDAPVVGAQSYEELKVQFSGASVLLAEDDPINREATKGLLESANLLVVVVNDGAEAVAAANHALFNLILMDLKMPNMGGIEATYAIREIKEHDHTPIVAVTANTFIEDRASCIHAGMNDYLAKPVTADQLYEVVLKWLRIAKAANSGELVTQIREG